MRLDDISILNFKNIEEASIAFSGGVNCLLGANGMGKSNMLEAVYYLSMMRSFLRLKDGELLRHMAPNWLLKARYTLDSGLRDEVSVAFEPPRRKLLRRGGKECQRLSQHIGTLPVVLVAPQDQQLITGTPSDRRRLMDTVISQGDPLYLEHLIAYGHAVTQRNALLRAESFDPLLTEGLDRQMATAGAYICRARQAWTEELRGPFTEYYNAISGAGEAPELAYRSALLDTDMLTLLRRNLERDRSVGHTSAGIHRDDLELTLSGYDLRRLGSQGQMKTYTVALRLAVFHYLRRATGQSPMLLLDDIFDKLDAGRVEGIIRMVSASEHFGQIFITDTGREHIDSILRKVGGPYLLLEAKEGAYTELERTE